MSSFKQVLFTAALVSTVVALAGSGQAPRID